MKAEISFFSLFVLSVVTSKRIPRQSSFGSGSSSCKTPDQYPGTCLNIRQCPPLLELLKNSRHKPGVADFLRDSVCGYDSSDPRVCCPRSQSDQPTTAGRRTTELIDRNNDEFPQLLSPPFCGNQSVQNTRIVGGQPAQLGSWPWITALGYNSRRNPTTQWLCGGVLVSSRHIITAAHCTRHPSLTLVKVRLGELDLDDRVRDGAYPVDILVDRVIAHPSYNPSKYTDDIAILRLKEDVEFSTFIRPICLPKLQDIRQLNFVNKSPFTAGWGSIKFKGPSLTNLQEVQVPVVSNEDCKKAYNTKGADIISRQLCAGKNGKDACQGDSGGPLMFPYKSSYYLIGVVSYGFRCAEAGFPGIYSRVTSYLSWIAQNMN